MKLKLLSIEISEMLELLVYFGSVLDISDRFGCLPVHTAARVSSEHVRLLLDAGSPIDRQDNAGNYNMNLINNVEFHT